MKNLTVVLGTARKGRESEKVARLIHKTSVYGGLVDVEYVDVRDHVTFSATTRFGEEELGEYEWKDIASKSDGFIFVLPEYNHGYPGEWKLLMDSLYKTEYMGKVAGIVGVSSGIFGGARAVEQATLSLATRGMYVLKDTLHIGMVKDKFEVNGDFSEEEDKKRMGKFIDNVIQNILK